jgi:hypothetical protein
LSVAEINTILVAVTGVSTGLFVISEALAQIPAVKGNSVFQVLQGMLKKLSGK